MGPPITVSHCGLQSLRVYENYRSQPAGGIQNIWQLVVLHVLVPCDLLSLPGGAFDAGALISLPFYEQELLLVLQVAAVQPAPSN